MPLVKRLDPPPAIEAGARCFDIQDSVNLVFADAYQRADTRQIDIVEPLAAPSKMTIDVSGYEKAARGRRELDAALISSRIERID